MQDRELHTYAQAVDLLREVKRSNDRINSSIGVEPHHLIRSCIGAQANPIEQALAQVERFIAHSERQYVGPDVLRRTATLKQQFRIQRDRRNMLLNSIKLEEIAQEEEKKAAGGDAGGRGTAVNGQEGQAETTAGQSDLLANAENLGVCI